MINMKYPAEDYESSDEEDIRDTDEFYDDDLTVPDFDSITLDDVLMNLSASDNESGEEFSRDEENVDLTWQSHFSWQIANNIPPAPHEFTGHPGINVDSKGFDVLDYFQLFFTTSLLNKIVEETNRYATQFIEDHPNLPRYSLARYWIPVTANEFNQFFGLILLMGINKLPHIQHYWSTDPAYDKPLFR